MLAPRDLEQSNTEDSTVSQWNSLTLEGKKKNQITISHNTRVSHPFQESTQNKVHKNSESCFVSSSSWFLQQNIPDVKSTL